jgi:hypothetical protein
MAKAGWTYKFNIRNSILPSCKYWADVFQGPAFANTQTVSGHPNGRPGKADGANN